MFRILSDAKPVLPVSSLLCLLVLTGCASAPSAPSSPTQTNIPAALSTIPTSPASHSTPLAEPQRSPSPLPSTVEGSTTAGPVPTETYWPIPRPQPLLAVFEIYQSRSDSTLSVRLSLDYLSKKGPGRPTNATITLTRAGGEPLFSSVLDPDETATCPDKLDLSVYPEGVPCSRSFYMPPAHIQAELVEGEIIQGTAHLQFTGGSYTYDLPPTPLDLK